MTATSSGKLLKSSHQNSSTDLSDKFWAWSWASQSLSVWRFCEEKGISYHAAAPALHDQVAKSLDKGQIYIQRLKRAHSEDVVFLWNIGFDTDEIAARLKMSERSIKNHIQWAVYGGKTSRKLEKKKVKPKSKYDDSFLVEVARMKDEQGRTQSFIADYLHKAFGEPVTVNMIASIVRRGRAILGVKPAPLKSHRATSTPRSAPQDARKAPQKPAAINSDPPPDGAVSLQDLRPDCCRAIVGYAEDGSALFCGQQKRQGSAYCEVHHKQFHTGKRYDYHKQLRLARSYR